MQPGSEIFSILFTPQHTCSHAQMHVFIYMLTHTHAYINTPHTHTLPPLHTLTYQFSLLLLHLFLLSRSSSSWIPLPLASLDGPVSQPQPRHPLSLSPSASLPAQSRCAARGETLCLLLRRPPSLSISGHAWQLGLQFSLFTMHCNCRHRLCCHL